MDIKVTSPAFQEGDMIDVDYSCDGSNISPPLSWENVPEDAKSIAIMVDDPDSPSKSFTHWIIFNLPPDDRAIEGNIPTISTLENGAVQGTNDAGEIGYFGPCPPIGETHRYVFHVFALDKTLDLHSQVKKDDFKHAINSHILAQGKLTAMYAR